MIKFFRKIRQNLLMQSKTGKYFKYAIGEILLVVIGILIALQINNWNENQKIIESEKQYVRNLIKDIESDKAFYGSRTTFLKIVSDIHTNFITVIENSNRIDILQKKLPIHYAFSYGFAFESSVVKNNPDYRSYISSPEISKHLKEIFLMYEYVYTDFNRYNEMKNELGMPLDIREHKNIKTVNQVTTYGDWSHVIKDPNNIGILTIFNLQNQEVLLQLEQLQNALDELMKVTLEWQKTNGN